jgi:hypothetical protein
MKTCKSGLHQYEGKRCPTCYKLSLKRWHENNKDSYKAKRKADYKANKNIWQARMKAYSEANKDTLKEKHAKYYQEHQEEIIAKVQVWQKANKEKHRTRSLEWQVKNPAKANARNARRRAAKLNATPKWLTREHLKQIERYYIVAKWVESILNEPIEVDHIVPLQGENVSGLHAPWNLQLLTEEENCSKKNKFTSCD